MTQFTDPSTRDARESSEESEFATFWHGPLNATVFSCLASFPANGAHLRLYTYAAQINPPEGVEVVDARAICADVSLLDRYIVGGRSSLATFSDRFRYNLMQQTGCCWVDADILALRQPNFTRDAIVWGRQPEAHGKALINNAVMKLPPGHPVLTEMLAKSEAAADVNLSWGAIGPFLLTEVAEKFGVYHSARDPSEFYSIGPDQFWQMLLPQFRDGVRVAMQSATFLHLWSEMLRRCAYDMSVAPPVGSLLYDIFNHLGTLDRFDRSYEERELTSLLTEWVPREYAPR